MRNVIPSVFSLFAFAAHLFIAPVFSLTYDSNRVKAAMAAASLVAEVEIETVQKEKDSLQGVRFVAKAKLLNTLRSSSALLLRDGDRVEISGPGGELGESGVLLPGFPRPYTGHRYLAHLNRSANGRYSIVGFEAGFTPLFHNRNSTRNRTDGSNGDGSGAFLFWDNSYFPLPYYFSIINLKENPDYLPAVDKSLNTWRKVDGTTVEFLPMGCTDSRTNGNDGLNQIVLIKSGWDLDPMAIAVTRNYYISGSTSRNGMIMDSDILLNGQNYRFTTTNEPGAHDVQNIVTHETGHLLGLGHETDPSDSNATMYAFAGPNETNKRTLHDNDLSGIRSAYPGVGNRYAGDLMTTNCLLGRPPSCLAVHESPPPSGAKSATALLLLALVIFAGRQLSRRRN